LLEEAMIPWQGRLKFRIYNPGKITKYGMLVRMVRQYWVISATWRYTQLRKYTVLSFLDRKLGQNHHIYQTIFIIV